MLKNRRGRGSFVLGGNGRGRGGGGQRQVWGKVEGGTGQLGVIGG